MIISLPAPPDIVSAPFMPFSTFAASFPFNRLSSSLPVPLMALVPVKANFSKYMPSVNEIEASTELTPPESRPSEVVSLRTSPTLSTR